MILKIHSRMADDGTASDDDDGLRVRDGCSAGLMRKGIEALCI